MSRDPSTHSEKRLSPKERKDWSLATGRDIQSKQDLDRYQAETGNVIVEKGFVPKPPDDGPTDDEVGKMIETHRRDRFSSAIDERVTLKPLEDCVAIEPVEVKISDTIVIPDQAKEKSTRGVVVALGPGRYLPDLDRREPIDLKVGDEVVFQKYSGTEIEVAGSSFWMVKESDVLVALEK